MPDRNRRGHVVLDNKTLPLVEDQRLGRNDQEHVKMLTFFEPNFEEALREVCREVADMRAEGLVRPFIEGEPIGAYVKTTPTPVTDAEVQAYHNKQRQWAREEMLALRAQNDAAIREILR